jgi:hypothetical protein
MTLLIAWVSITLAAVLVTFAWAGFVQFICLTWATERFFTHLRNASLISASVFTWATLLCRIAIAMRRVSLISVILAALDVTLAWAIRV